MSTCSSRVLLTYNVVAERLELVCDYWLHGEMMHMMIVELSTIQQPATAQTCAAFTSFYCALPSLTFVKYRKINLANYKEKLLQKFLMGSPIRALSQQAISLYGY